MTERRPRPPRRPPRSAASTTSSGGSATPAPSPASSPRPSASTWSPTPAPRPVAATASATCSSRAASASWCRARCTPTARSPSTCAPTATASATSASSSTTSPAAYDAALARGATSLREPAKDEDAHGVIHHAAIRAYGDTVHTFLDRSAYTGPFAPQFEPTDLRAPGRARGRASRGSTTSSPTSSGATSTSGSATTSRCSGFDQLTHFDDDQISTEYSALMSTVVWNHDKVVLPINEPAEGRRKSQIEEYLDFYGAPGVQHIALHTPDIVESVRALRARGVRFMDVPRRVLRRGPRADGRASSCRGRRWPSSASSSTATTRATCSRSSPRPSPTGPRCSSRSSSARAPPASARATSRRCSSPSSEPRPAAATSRPMDGVPQWVRGVTSRQAHVGLPPGTVEEEHGRSGFFGPASHLYRLHAPTDWVDGRGPGRPPRLRHPPARPGATTSGPRSCSATTSCRSPGTATSEGRPEFLRDADGDELFFVHAGAGPPAHRVRPARLPHRRLPRRAAGHHLPLRAHRAHRPARGRGLRVALPAARQGPARPPRPVRPRHARGARGRGGRRGGRVHRRREAARARTPASPTRSTPATWSGGRATSRRCGSTSTTSGPVTSARYHLPPSAHTTFVADGFVVCTFAPRPLEEDPDALRLPFFHRNVDYDEVILYHRGEFFSRAGHRRGHAHLAPVRPAPRPPAGRPGARRRRRPPRRRASGAWPTRSR